MSAAERGRRAAYAAEGAGSAGAGAGREGSAAADAKCEASAGAGAERDGSAASVAERTASDPALIDRVEAHACAAWPALLAREWGDGWLLRATPGLARARSNNALTPRRALRVGELDAAVAAASDWSARWGTPLGMQVVPLDVHSGVIAALELGGWRAAPAVQVLGADREAAVLAGAAGGRDAPALEVSRGPSPDWVASWAACDASHDADAVAGHARTVFARLGERGLFMRLEDLAVGIAVPGEGLVGLFALAVRPELRGQGLGRRLVTEMLAAVDEPLAYLQVSSANAVALSLYARLGFAELYRYRHVLAPNGIDPSRL